MQPNRPQPQFSTEDQVVTNDERSGFISQVEWSDGEWTYRVHFPFSDKLVRYAEHELEAAR